MVGGAVSFFVMRVAGRAIDRFGPARVATVGTAMLIVVLQIWFVSPGQRTSGAVVALFVCMMMGVSVRNVSMSSLATRVPALRPAGRLHVVAVDGPARRFVGGGGAARRSCSATALTDG